MKQLLLSAVIAAIVSLLIVMVGFQRNLDRVPVGPVRVVSDSPTAAVVTAPPSLRITDALVEDTWIDASRTAGSDLRTLTDASTSMCYLTKIEISGVQGPDDTNSCAVEIDDFTGFWQLIATVEEGGRSEVRCNARCLTWESSGTER
jgi:hypothetical protein